MFKMNLVKVLAASLIDLFTFAANESTTISAPAPNSKFILTAGTTVVLELAQKVTPKSVSIGNSIRFKVRDNVKVNGKTVIAAGATAVSYTHLDVYKRQKLYFTKRTHRKPQHNHHIQRHDTWANRLR